MSDKPEALRLAESAHLGYRIEWQVKAAAELRRLHAVEVQRNELLEALQEVVAFTGAHGGPYVRARAAIAKATGEAT